MATIPTSAADARALEAAGYVFNPGVGYEYVGLLSGGSGGVLSVGGPDTPPSITPEAAGLDPATFASTLYNKKIPLWLGGISLIGGRVIEGPLFGVADHINTASWISGFCIPANYENDTRSIRSLRLNGVEVWRSPGPASLSGLAVNVPTAGSTATVRFNTGTLDQSPDAWSVGRFGSLALAYPPMVTATFENIRLSTFNNKIPFASVELADSYFGDPDDGLSWGAALEALARYDGRSSDDFDAIGLTGRIIALILANDATFPEFLSGMRQHKPHWNIRTSDKLYVVEKGPLSLDLSIDTGKLVTRIPKTIVIDRGDAFALPRERLTTFIDFDRDYEPTTVRAAEDRDPVPSTDAFSSESINVSVVSTAVEMLSETNYAYYYGELARQTSQYTGAQPYLGVEPGDVHKIPTGFGDAFQCISEVERKPEHQVNIKGSGFLTCGISNDPFIAFTVLIAGFNGLDGAIEYTADTGQVGTFAGNARIDTEQFAYGISALRSANSTDFISFPNSTIYDLAASDTDEYTIEWSQFLPDLAHTVTVFQNGFNFEGLEVRADTTTMSFFWNDTGGTSRSVTKASAGFVAGQWQDCCIEKNSSNVMRFYIGGAMVHKATIAAGQGGIEPSTFDLSVGARAPGVVCYTERVRVTKAARYNSDGGYSPLTTEFPTPV